VSGTLLPEGHASENGLRALGMNEAEKNSVSLTSIPSIGDSCWTCVS